MHDEDATVEGRRPEKVDESEKDSLATDMDPLSQVTEAGWAYARTTFSTNPSSGASFSSLGEQRRAGATFPLINVVGAGGIGEIWKAKQTSLERVIAVKRMQSRYREQFANDPARLLELQHSFRQEALITASLEHPNIVPIYDLGHDAEGNPLLAMKLIKGERWDHLIVRDYETLHPLELLDRHLPTFLAMIQAVAFAHSKGIVHRDIKPSQVMVGEFGEVVLMDWGLAVYVGPERGPSDSSVDGMPPLWILPTPETAQGRAGTPSLMSPEQTLNHARKITRSTDIFLLGATLYYLLTGSYLYEGGTTESAIARAAKCEIDPFDIRNPGRYVPPELARICMSALAARPEDRIPSATQFMVLLQDYISGASDRRASDELLEQLRSRLGGSDPNSPPGLILTDLPPDAPPGEVYREFAACMSMLDKARGLWPKNPQIPSLDLKITTSYAQAALERGDVVLATTLIQRLPIGPELQRLKLDIDTRELRRKHFSQTRRLAIRLSLFFGIALVISMTLLFLQQAFAFRQLNQFTQSLDREKRAALQANLNMMRAQSEQQLDSYFYRIAFANLAINSRQGTTVFSTIYSDYDSRLRQWEWGRLLAKLHPDRMTIMNTSLPDQILHAEYSPDGARIVTGEMDGFVRLWDSRTGRLLLASRPHTAGIWSTRFSRDGSRIITSSFDQTGTVLNAVTLEPVQLLPLNEDIQRGGSLSPDGKMALTVSRDRNARLIRISDGSLLWNFTKDTVRWYDSDFHPREDILVVAGQRTALILRISDGSIVASLPAHPGNILGIRFSPDGSLIATACADRVLRVFTTDRQTMVFSSLNETAYLHSVAWSPDGALLATGDDSGRLAIWDANDGQLLGSVESRSSMYKINFSPDGRRIVVATAVTCQVFDVDSILARQERRTLVGSMVRDSLQLTTESLSRLAIYSSPYERIGAWPGYDTLWRVPGGRNEIRMNNWRVLVDSYYTAVHPDGTQTLDLHPFSGQLTRSNLLKPEELPIPMAEEGAYWIGFSNSGHLATIMAPDHGLVAYDTETWTRRWTVPQAVFGDITTATRFVGRAIFAPDDSTVAVGTFNGTAYILNSEDGQIIHHLRPTSRSAFFVKYSPDGSRVATGGLATHANLWDVETGDLVTTMTGLDKFLLGMVFTPDSQRLITATNDDRIRLWDTNTGREVMEIDNLIGQEMLVGIGMSPCGRAAFSADSYGRIRIYEAFPFYQHAYPGTVEDKPELRTEWLKRQERTGSIIQAADLADFLKVSSAPR